MVTMVFRGSRTEFLAWLAGWGYRHDPELDASIARHPAGKRIGRG